MATVKQLKAQLTQLNVAFPSKANKAQLTQLVEQAHAPVRKQRTSTKQILRNLFPNVGDSMLVADVVAAVQEQASVQAATIVTMIGDLKNSKYAAGPCINIVRNNNTYTRES
jgi:hypothetical protein